MIYEELLVKYEEVKEENIILRTLLKDNGITFDNLLNTNPLDKIENSNEEDSKTIKRSVGKIELFKSLFVGRTDVIAKQFQYKNKDKVGYTPYCRNDWKYGVCPKKKGHSTGLCKSCKAKSFINYSDTIIKKHLKGEATLG